MPWPLSNHESPDLQLRIPRVTAAHYLWAMLSAEGEEFRSPYKPVRDYLDEAVREFEDRTTGGQAPSSAVNDSRLRTWKRIFEQFGLLTVDEEQRIRATRLGRAVADGASTAQTTIDQANHHIAELGALVADRVLLAAPNRHGQLPVAVPPDSDLRPLRTIWKAFRRQGNKLHWQDVNRVLGHVHFERDVDAAIDRITAFRAVHPSSYPTDVAILDTLGQALTDDVRKITPWFTRAGVGGMLIPPEMDSLGFRILDAAAVPIIDQLLAMPLAPVPANARSESAAYVAYLMAPVDRVETPAVPASDAAQVQTVLDAVRRFGRHRFIVLSGLPGTGKTRLARMAAGQLTDGDKLRLKVIQFHKGTAYDDFIEGFVPRPDGQGFERRYKTLRLMNQRALDNPGKTHVLLIEELTRADVVAVLGELLTYIEHRDESFTFSLSQEESVISPDLVVLCTMNPRDRSAMSLDDAVSRRMHRIAVPPSSEGLVAMLRGRLPDEVLDRLDAWYREHLAVLPFGHGIFEGATDRDALRGIWEGTVVPLISDPLGRVVEAYRAAYDAFPLRGDFAEPAVAAPEPTMPTVASPGGD